MDRESFLSGRPDIDTWLRDFKVSPSSRNSMLTDVKVLFSFALTHNYLPGGRKTAACNFSKVAERKW